MHQPHGVISVSWCAMLQSIVLNTSVCLNIKFSRKGFGSQYAMELALNFSTHHNSVYLHPSKNIMDRPPHDVTIATFFPPSPLYAPMLNRLYNELRAFILSNPHKITLGCVVEHISKY